MTRETSTDDTGLSCPYPGLRPFRSDEAVVFFGRDQQVDQLLERLGRQRFVAVVGTSGCGKSSLVQAGLIPALGAGLLGTVGARWSIATMRPGDQPLRRLAEGLLDPAVLGSAWLDLDNPISQVHALLQRGPLGLAEVLGQTPLTGGRTLLVLVDQFEELFRFRREGEGQRDEANAFVSLLLATVRVTDCPVYIVLTMRSDYLGDCSDFEGLPEALNDSQFLTPKLSRVQRRQAIEEPARVVDGRVEPALVNRLLNDTGSGPDQLPLMQHALMRLWKLGTPDSEGSVELTLASYEALGGLEGALSGQADAAYGTLDPGRRRITEALFRRLSERTTSGRDIRRPTKLEEVARVAAVAPEEVLSVADVFRDPDRCFLTPAWPREIRPIDVLDISHESLIRHWGRLRAWVDAESESAEVYRRLDQTARLWSEGFAGLWGTPDLDQALRWKEYSRPNAAWAARYGGDFERAMRFLDASVADRERKQAEERRRLADEAEKNRRLAEFERQRAEVAEARERLAAEEARYQEQLSRNVLMKNKTIFDISRFIASAMPIDALAPKILDSLMELFAQAERGFLVLMGAGDPTPSIGKTFHKLRLVHPSADEGRLTISRTLLRHVLNQRQSILSQDVGNDPNLPADALITNLKIRSVMCVPLLPPDGHPLGILQLDTSDRKQFGPEDLELLVAVASQAAIAIQNARMHEDLIARERLDRDLRLAQQVQMRFLPRRVPEVPGYQFFAYYSAAYQVGGDYYDFVSLPGNRLAIVLGDVAGKGVAAALIMAKFSVDTRYCILTESTPAAAAAALNHLLCEAGIEEQFVALILGSLDLARGELTLCSAGHVPVLIRRANGVIEEVGGDITGFPLGILHEQQYREALVRLAPGDVVVMCSDGVLEQRNTRQELYESGTDRRLSRRIAEMEGGPESIGQGILRELREFSAGEVQADDITLVCFGRTI